MATLKQKTAIAKMVENGGIVSKAMIEAGYSENTAKTPQKLTESVEGKRLISSIVDKMERERDRLILYMADKDLSKEKYRDMMEAVDKLTKNIQLLNGGATERHGLILNFDSSFNAAS